ncbi:MAG: NADH:flavin oxidoreductase [Polyangiaceae bacterium]
MIALSPVRVGALELRNRFVKTATFEGMSPRGRVSEALVAHHAAMARHGVALTTVAYGAVEPSGRTFGDQLLVTAETDLARIADAVHAEGGAVSLQLAHSGGFTKLRHPRGPAGPSEGINAYGIAHGAPWIKAMTSEDIERVTAAYAQAATVARDAGFDALELHCGHGYLLSQFLSPAMNRRRDAWGGDLQGRLRLPLAVVRAIRDVVGEKVALLAKINLEDGVHDGSTIDDAVVIARALAQAGVDALVPSGGLVQRNAFFLMRGDVPIREMAATETSLLGRVAMRVFAPWLVKAYPYTSAFFEDRAARVLGAVDIPVGLLGGVDSADVIERALERGFSFVAMGRALLADPDFIERLAAGERVVSRCTHCNRCVAEMDRSGVRCVLA